jgi:basic membrane lipoprotein Med (substrate-binding protein (PBP1-ABC) superfamily)
VYALVEDLVAGNFEAGDKMYDLQTGAVDYASSEANVLTDAAKEAAEAAKAAILAGDIVVAADRDGYNEKYGDKMPYTLK